MNNRLDLSAGTFSDQAPQSNRALGELGPIFRDQASLAAMDGSTPVYATYGCPGEVEGPARLLYATTVLQPGRVGDEFFMTRGHFHAKPERGEFMVTLRGEGALVLMDRGRETWMESMSPGSVHDIDGAHAHRVANTGDEPLVFLVVWMSDCGHDYESIREQGFGKILVAGEKGPELKA